MSTWKRDFASGLIVLAPLLVLLLVLRWIYQYIASIPLIEGLQPEIIPAPLEPVSRVIIAFAVFATVVLAVGYFMRTTLGRLAESAVDDAINRIPALRVVYNASKLAIETAISGTDELQSPVYIETWPGIRMTAFRTGKKTRDGKIVLFMPTAPNITTGFVIEVEPERIEETGETVEEGMTRVLSAGFAESAHQVPVHEENPDEGDGGRTPGGFGHVRTDGTAGDSAGSTAEESGSGE
ncbi:MULTISPECIES: DUF502 domain-containing protein [Halorubrum]|uniref:Uncharacterized membrane protein n=1 Tax=Halorubrum sodomense TaxID=35743 RepID=A0A1I6FUI2_HALSD|nr:MULTISPECIES: DUF502 domain-containing protein [Halorubrum]TKX53655.1 DUF502 domain-containing protein [Halorubrum sp. SP3]TKX69544.1 DUF502 domain-containing protein [Halorubrum sp. SP9]SFR33568.1 Uncharacterized membrane protein [Halorubrum sodomense]